VSAQPLDELDDLGATPHPGRKAAEAGERFTGIGVVAGAADVPVDAGGVRPISLGGYRHEATLLDHAW
jgi:hypothetical protein